MNGSRSSRLNERPDLVAALRDVGWARSREIAGPGGVSEYEYQAVVMLGHSAGAMRRAVRGRWWRAHDSSLRYRKRQLLELTLLDHVTPRGYQVLGFR